MASLVISAAMAATRHPPSITTAISGVFGSISLTAWICVILPQLYANFKAQNADGLSMAFLVVWLLGDATNFLGAIFTHLAPTAIILPSYFVLADMILISQCAYYNHRNKQLAKRHQHHHHHHHHSEVSEASEQSPLLRRSSHHEANTAAIVKPSDDEIITEAGSAWSNNILSLVAVYVVGIAAYLISYKVGIWDEGDPAPATPDEDRTPLEIAGLTLGYVSAVFYLCARVPQIVKNYREKSCEGLSILFFMLSLTGNLTYGISIMSFSQEKKYLLNALPFLLGSLGTIVEDCIIFVQFRLYTGSRRSVATVE